MFPLDPLYLMIFKCLFTLAIFSGSHLSCLSSCKFQSAFYTLDTSEFLQVFYLLHFLFLLASNVFDLLIFPFPTLSTNTLTLHSLQSFIKSCSSSAFVYSFKDNELLPSLSLSSCFFSLTLVPLGIVINLAPKHDMSESLRHPLHNLSCASCSS